METNTLNISYAFCCIFHCKLHLLSHVIKIKLSNVYVSEIFDEKQNYRNLFKLSFLKHKTMVFPSNFEYIYKNKSKIIYYSLFKFFCFETQDCFPIAHR